MDIDIDTSTNDLNSWVALWDKVQGGVTTQKKPEAEENSNFFGLPNGEDISISSKDVEEWKMIYDHTAFSGNVIQEVSRPDTEIINQNDLEKRDMADVAKVMSHSPNPIYPYSTGKDQDLDGKSLDQTFSEKDLENLADMKVRLHQMECELNTFEGRGENSEKHKSQIDKIKKQIDKLSDSLSVAYKEWHLE